MRSDVSATIRKCPQDQPIKAPLLSQKAWRGQEESIETENADLSKGWQSGFEQKISGLPWQTQTCWMEGLHAINKAEQGCCALDRGGDFAFAFDRSACA